MKRGFAGLFAAAAVMVCPACLCAADFAGETTGSVIKRAMQLTAQSKLPEAEKLYRDLATSSPVDGFPALARFLARSGQTTAAADLLQNDAALQKQPSVVRGRTAIAAGKHDLAISLLKTPEQDPNAEYQRVLLLANQLENTGNKDGAAAAIEQAAVSPSLSVADRKDLFGRLVTLGGADYLVKVLPGLLESLITSSSLSFVDIRPMAVQGLISLSTSPDFSAHHRKLQELSQQSASGAWLFALSSIRRGDSESATAAIEAATSRTLTNREKVMVYEELAKLLTSNPGRALEYYLKIIPLAPDPDRIRLICGQIQFKLHRYQEAVELLLPLDSTKLGEGDQVAYSNVLMTSLAQIGSTDALIEAFEKHGDKMPWEKLRELAEAPFIMMQPEEITRLKAAIQKRLSAASASPALHVLCMSLENRLENEEGVLQSLGAYVTARPEVYGAVQEYAEAMGRAAFKLATQDPQTSPPIEQLQKMGDEAAKAFWKAIESRPYAPEAYTRLMALYELYGQKDKARMVPQYLTKSTTATAEEIHLAAYMLATNGYPEDALPVYERALKLSPENGRFRLNQAGALSRVGKHREATGIYRKLLEEGVNGKQFHSHETHSNSYGLAKLNGYLDEHVTFLRSLIPKKEVPQHDMFLMEAGKSLLKFGQPDQAEAFFTALRESYPEHRAMAVDQLVECEVGRKNYDAAEKLLSDEIGKTTDTAGAIVVRSNLAVVKKNRGDLNAAIAEWQKIAHDYPKERTGTRSLITAAQALVEAGRLQHATRMLEQYLALDAGDVDAEQSARETLARLRTLDVPAEAIVQSVLQEGSAGTTPTQNSNKP